VNAEPASHEHLKPKDTKSLKGLKNSKEIQKVSFKLSILLFYFTISLVTFRKSLPQLRPPIPVDAA
jgi:hypothetical protein